MESARIEEYEDLELVETVAERYAHEFGAEPLNLSHWDPSPTFIAQLGRGPSLDLGIDPVPYIYSYTLESTDPLLRRLGFDPTRRSCLVTPGGTTSMLCAVNWAASRSPKLSVLCPLYFPVLHQARHRSLSVDRYFMRRDRGRYFLPDGALESAASPVWLTSPVYCTGVRLGNDDKRRLLRFGSCQAERDSRHLKLLSKDSCRRASLVDGVEHRDLVDGSAGLRA